MIVIIQHQYVAYRGTKDGKPYLYLYIYDKGARRRPPKDSKLIIACNNKKKFLAAVEPCFIE